MAHILAMLSVSAAWCRLCSRCIVKCGAPV